MDDPSTQAFLLAALTAGGGLTGYIRTGSVPSVAAGMTVGALYGLGGLRLRNRQSYGLEMALLASLVLAASSVPRAIKSQKPLPIGLSVVAAFGLYRFGTIWRAQV
ncbi:transmembrane proteins 14C-domain-containing protein [Usnea florida]